MIINEQGRKFANLDHVVEEGSKKWGMTLVGYFVGMKMPHWEISGHLRRMWRSYHFVVNLCLFRSGRRVVVWINQSLQKFLFG